MKKVIDLLFVLVLLTFAFPALAQDESSLSEITLKKTHFDNWYVSIGPSANLLFAEQDGDISFSKRLKFGGEISVGKWFNQNSGVSLNILAGGLRGFNYSKWISPGYYTPTRGQLFPNERNHYPIGGDPLDPANRGKYTFVKAKNGTEGFWQDFNFAVTTFDLMINFTNLSRGYAVERSWFDLIGFAGLGVNVTFSNKLTTPDFYMVTGRAGLRANFNVTNNIAIYLEPVAYATDPEFDGYRGTAVGDLYASLSLGIQYTINKRVFSFEKVTIDELDRLNRRVNENRDLIENHQDILERQQRLLDKLGNSLSSKDNDKSVPVVRKEVSMVLPEYVRFALDSYRIEKTEAAKIQAVVDFLKGNPDAKVLLVGYADRKTGNPTYNYDLSKKRVDTVRDEIKRFGIPESRLFVEWKGDREQPFTTNEWNRVVIMVERK